MWVDSLLWLPLVTGLLAAALLARLGVWLRLREEWLAAFGIAHVAAAGAMLGAAAGAPALAVAPLAAAAGAVLKRMHGRGNAGYVLMILGGWSLMLLAGANLPGLQVLGTALIDGQLYFAQAAHLGATAALFVLVHPVVTRIGRLLLRAELFPAAEQANPVGAWRWHLGFDLLLAVTLAVATLTLGVMAVFALVFIPARFAFQSSANWRRAQSDAVALGVLGFLIAYALALWLDQPFGPVVVLVLLVLYGLARTLRASPRKTAAG